MTSSPSTSARRRVRPITWAILAWMLIMIAGIVGAWQGSEAKFGAVPTLHASTTGELIEVPPFAAGDLDGQVYENPIPEIDLESDGLLSLRMPSEINRVSHWVFEIRDGEQFERYIPAGEGDTHVLVDATTDNGRLEGVSVRATPTALDSEGEETAFDAEWAVEINQLGAPVSAEGLEMHGEPSAPSVDPSGEGVAAPDDAVHSGAAPSGGDTDGN